MSDIFHDYTFEFSVPGDPDHELPPDYFSIIPLRTSKFKDKATKGSADMTEKWKQDSVNTNSNNINPNPCQVGSLTDRGHIVSWITPELPPDQSQAVTFLGEMLLLSDDKTDILDKDAHNAVIDDIALGLLEHKKLNRSPQFDFPLNQTLIDSVRNRPLAGISTELCQNMLSSTPSLAVPTLDMPFEQYKDLRRASSGSLHFAFYSWSSLALQLSDEEKASVEYIFDKSYLIFGLMNDLYIFFKEFEDHSHAGTLDKIHNCIPLVMHGYGYSEEEARNIICQEIFAAEKDLLEAYRAWEISHVAKSSGRLRRYIV